MSLALLIFMSATVYRICRLMILDKIGEPWRDKFFGFLADHPNKATVWLQTLLMCPYCVSVWVSGFLTLAVWYFHPLTLPPLYWAASATGALVFWMMIDSED